MKHGDYCGRTSSIIRSLTTSTTTFEPLGHRFFASGEVSVIGIQFVLPTLAGWWGYQKLGTGYLFLGIGLVLGMGMAIFSLLRIVNPPKKS